MLDATDATDATSESDKRASEICECEPTVINDILLTGLTAVRTDDLFRFVGWTDVLDTRGYPTERRIEVRFSLAESPARELLRRLGVLKGFDN